MGFSEWWRSWKTAAGTDSAPPATAAHDAWDAGRAAERERIAAALERRAGELRVSPKVRRWDTLRELERMAALIREDRE